MDTSNDNSPKKSALTSNAEKSSWRRHLVDQRLTMSDHEGRSDWLQRVLRVWLVERADTVIGAYWPIKGEFDVLPALFRWQEAGREGDAVEAPIQRRIGLPVMNKTDKTLQFHAWYPGCPMEEDAYNIPKPKDTDRFAPQLLLVPCVGFGPSGLRLGYGGGFYDRTLATLEPHPFTVGVGYAHGFIPWLQAEPLLTASRWRSSRCRCKLSTMC